MPTHMPAPKHLRWNNFKQIMTVLWAWKNSDKSTHYIIQKKKNKKCIRQWITFPYVFRNGVCAHANTFMYTHAECANEQFLCIVYLSLDLSSMFPGERQKQASNLSFSWSIPWLPAGEGLRQGEQCKAQKQLLCSQETQTSWFRSWDSELLPLYNL